MGRRSIGLAFFAAFERANLPEKDRPYFGIYCDEFQEFATPDFARLFTQTGARWRTREREAKPWDSLRAMEGRIGLMNCRCGDIRGGRTGTWGYNMLREEDLIWHPANVYTWFMWLKSFPEIPDSRI